MSETKYKINPVKATCMKYDCKDHGIQGLNDTCFGICGAYSGTNDVYDMDPACSNACEKLIEKRREEIFGVGRCDHQTPFRPVLWQEVPRYVPRLLNNGVSPSAAREQCLSLCDKYVSSNNNLPCKENCILDYNAIVLEDYKEPDNIPTQGKKKHNIWLPLIILIILLVAFLIIIKFSKN